MSIAISPDQRHLVAAQSGVVCVWSLATSARVREVMQPNVMTQRGWAETMVAFDPSGAHAITAIGNTVTVWDPTLETSVRAIVGKFDASTAAITALLVLSDERAITGHFDGMIRRWDLARGVAVRGNLKGHKRRIYQLALDPEGRLVSAGVDCTVRRWDVEKGTSEVVLERLPGYPIGLDAIHGRVAVASAGGIHLEVVTFEGKRKALPGHVEAATDAAFFSDGRRVASAGPDLRVHDVVTGECLQVFDTGGNVAPITILGDRILGAGAGLQIHDTSTVAETPAIEIRARHADHVYDACALGDGFATCSGDTTIKLWRADGSFRTSLRGHDHAVSTVRALSGSRLISCGYDRRVLLWDLERSEVLQTFDGCREWIIAMAVSADERRIATVEHNGVTRVLDLASGKLVARLELEDERAALALSPDGKRLFVASRDGRIDVFDVATRAFITTLRGHEGAVTALAVDPVSNVLLSTGDQLRSWSLDALAEVGSFRGHKSKIVGISVGNDFVATGDDSGRVLFWDLPRGPNGGRERSCPRPTAFAARDDCSFVFGAGNGDVLVVPPL